MKVIPKYLRKKSCNRKEYKKSLHPKKKKMQIEKKIQRKKFERIKKTVDKIATSLPPQAPS